MLERVAGESLAWYPELGLGFYNVTAGAAPYDQAYFERFARQADTPIGRELMRARVEFVAKHFAGTLCDVGIGSGAFIETRRGRGLTTYGYDVNPAGVAWLERRGLFFDPHMLSFRAISLWDVLEHIPDFSSLLERVGEFVFVSLPIFNSAEHVLRSKHFRKDEHCWYFTRAGLARLMGELGFDLVEESELETRAGREDIGAFCFRRRQ